MLIQADARRIPLADSSVHMCVTSPPYWGLRDYGTARWEGGDAECDHKKDRSIGVFSSGLEGGKATTNHQQEASYRDICAKCGAHRIDNQLGLEPDIEAYVANMVAVGREIKRVLRDDGTFWLNLGSSYASSTSHQNQSRPVRREAECGSDGKGQLGLTEIDCAYFRPDDGCQDDSLSHRARNSRSAQLLPEDGAHPCKTDHDSGPMGCEATSPDVSVRGVQGSTTRACSRCDSGACALEATASACPSEFHSCAGGSPPFSRTGASMIDRPGLLPTSADHISGTAPSCAAYDTSKDSDALTSLYYTIRTLDFKAKNLIPIPFLVALALQADGWILRSDIIWAKKNCMPESCADRPTTAHEHLFLLAKSPRYYYDADAIREPAEYGRRIWSDVEAVLASATRAGDTRTNHGVRAKASVTGADPSAGRNRRTVWEIPTNGFPGAHFATYPPELIRPCIRAGTSARGVCPICGAPWVRVVERTPANDPKCIRKSARTWTPQDLNVSKFSGNMISGQIDYSLTHTTGWRPSCACGGEPVPALVLDPFAGSGTTGVVCREEGRAFVGLDLSAAYLADLAAPRLAGTQPALAGLAL